MSDLLGPLVRLVRASPVPLSVVCLPCHALPLSECMEAKEPSPASFYSSSSCLGFCLPAQGLPCPLSPSWSDPPGIPSPWWRLTVVLHRLGVFIHHPFYYLGKDFLVAYLRKPNRSTSTFGCSPVSNISVNTLLARNRLLFRRPPATEGRQVRGGEGYTVGFNALFVQHAHELTHHPVTHRLGVAACSFTHSSKRCQRKGRGNNPGIILRKPPFLHVSSAPYIRQLRQLLLFGLYTPHPAPPAPGRGPGSTGSHGPLPCSLRKCFPCHVIPFTGLLHHLATRIPKPLPALRSRFLSRSGAPEGVQVLISVLVPSPLLPSGRTDRLTSNLRDPSCILQSETPVYSVST